MFPVHGRKKDSFSPLTFAKRNTTFQQGITDNHLSIDIDLYRFQ